MKYKLWVKNQFVLTYVFMCTIFYVHVFFYKHNVYKHTEAQIPKKLSIF